MCFAVKDTMELPATTVVVRGLLWLLGNSFYINCILERFWSIWPMACLDGRNGVFLMEGMVSLDVVNPWLFIITNEEDENVVCPCHLPRAPVVATHPDEALAASYTELDQAQPSENQSTIRKLASVTFRRAAYAHYPIPRVDNPTKHCPTSMRAVSTP